MKYSANAICNTTLLFANAKSNEGKRIKRKKKRGSKTALSQPKVRPVPKLCEHIFGLAVGRTGCADGACRNGSDGERRVGKLKFLTRHAVLSHGTNSATVEASMRRSLTMCEYYEIRV